MDSPGEVLQRDIGHAEQHPGGHAEQQSLCGGSEAASHRDADQGDTEREHAALDGDQRRQRVVTQRAECDPPVTAITASPNAVMITPDHWRRPR